MKSERRHELRENDLIHFLHTVRDYLDERGGRVAFLVMLGVVIAAVATFALRSRAAAMEDVWKTRAKLSFTELEQGRESLQTLKQISEGVSDRRFVMDSLMDQGRQALNLAQLAPDPPDQELTKSAQRSFEALVQQYPENPVAVGVGLLGLATVQENLFVLDGDMAHRDKAHDILSRIILDTKLNGLPVQTVATKRREALDTTFSRITLASSPIITEEVEPEPADAEPANVDVP